MTPGRRREGTSEAREAAPRRMHPPSAFVVGEGPALSPRRVRTGFPPPLLPLSPEGKGPRGALLLGIRAGERSRHGAAVVTVSLLSFVWKVPHTLQNNNGFCLHIPVFLLSASSAKL